MRKTTKHGVRHGQKMVVDFFGIDVTVVFDTKSDSEHVIVKRLDGTPLARQAKNMSHLVVPASWTNPSPGYYAFPMEYFHRGDGEWRSYSDVGREGEIRDRRMLARVIDQLGEEDMAIIHTGRSEEEHVISLSRREALSLVSLLTAQLANETLDYSDWRETLGLEAR